MFEFSTIWMEVYGSTESEDSDVISYDRDVNNNIIYNQELPNVCFTELPFIEEAIAVSLTVCLGFLLNLVFFRCFWRSKSSAAVYIRVLAYYDMCVLASLALNFVIKDVPNFPKFQSVVKTASFLQRLLAAFTIIGPLFLALDRFLVVTFPHKFQNYTNGMRKAKGGIIVVAVATNVLAQLSVFVLGFESTMTSILAGILTLFLATQFLTCVVLYAVIFAKIVHAERKMAKHRHIGSRYKTPH